MPELLEIEIYRGVAEMAVGRPIASVSSPDDWYLKDGLDADSLSQALVGRTIVFARRKGKLLLADLDDGATVGLRFGMTGRLIVDDDAPIEQLEYGPAREDPSWDRLTVVFVDGGTMRLNDARRLGGVFLDPDEAELGPDAQTISLDELTAALARGRGPLKARLLDQKRVAGLGNLLVDDVLWRAGLSPQRVAGSLADDDVARLHRSIGESLAELGGRGGSHTGDLQSERDEGVCPRCGTRLLRETVGGRTSVWCPEEQR